jgi:hypothetical protein
MLTDNNSSSHNLTFFIVESRSPQEAASSYFTDFQFITDSFVHQAFSIAIPAGGRGHNFCSRSPHRRAERGVWARRFDGL